MQPTEERRQAAKQLLAELKALYSSLAEKEQDEVRFRLIESGGL